ncbi:MAG: hypothetical protein OXD47_08535, partial [Gammaproteobacteria bacterium]|nr:hypothetical protein [Gammaproteobacteria bacterium]MCY4338829.1 hypothetical protein [Gammaproteobacteria bacterium]
VRRERLRHAGRDSRGAGAYIFEQVATVEKSPKGPASLTIATPDKCRQAGSEAYRQRADGLEEIQEIK